MSYSKICICRKNYLISCLSTHQPHSPPYFPFCTIQVSNMSPIRGNPWVCKYSWYNPSFLVITSSNHRYQLACLWCRAGGFFHALLCGLYCKAMWGVQFHIFPRQSCFLGHQAPESWSGEIKGVLQFSGRPGTNSTLPTCVLESERLWVWVSFLQVSIALSTKWR